jgi:hypothetical protein
MQAGEACFLMRPTRACIATVAPDTVQCCAASRFRLQRIIMRNAVASLLQAVVFCRNRQEES